jgi:hypothetical protein
MAFVATRACHVQLYESGIATVRHTEVVNDMSCKVIPVVTPDALFVVAGEVAQTLFFDRCQYAHQPPALALYDIVLNYPFCNAARVKSLVSISDTVGHITHANPDG